MKKIYAGDRTAVTIAGASAMDSGKRFRLSQFVTFPRYEGKLYLHNNLTVELYGTDAAETASLLCLREMPISGADAAAAGYEPLIRHGILVPEDRDETDRYLGMLRFLRALQNKKGMTKYTILPTTDCNARCVYCFEKGIRHIHMSPETAVRTAAFIAENSGGRAVSITWYGGEPLMGHAVISRISRVLSDLGISFTADLITNGTLLTPELADTAGDVWHVDSVQITMDGTRADYEARKQYLQPAIHNYDRMCEAVRLLSARGISVRLRVNCDAENAAHMGQLAEDVQQAFGDLENVSFYFSLLDQAAKSPDCLSVRETLDAVETACREKELPVDRSVAFRARFKTSFCTANRPFSGAVIRPDGKLVACYNLPEDMIYGDIWQGVTDTACCDRLINPPLQEACRGCPYLPVCTPFRALYCPSTPPFPICRQMMEQDEPEAIRALFESELADEADGPAPGRHA